jgi:hypothetical protein
VRSDAFFDEIRNLVEPIERPHRTCGPGCIAKDGVLLPERPRRRRKRAMKNRMIGERSRQMRINVPPRLPL